MLEVHILLFQHRLAPELRWCGTVYGGPMMVVMHEVAGSTIQDALADREPVREADVAGVDRALSVLGDAFVHGDLRASNVVLKPTADGAKEPYIVDFKWAGRAGIARYPRSDIFAQIPDELRNKLITRQHDKDMRASLLPPRPRSTSTTPSKPSRKRS